MNKYIINKSSLLKLDTETLDINTLNNSYNIDCMWFIEESGTLKYDNKEYEVKAGDTVMMMYRIGDEKGEVIILNNKELIENYKRRMKHYETKKANCNDNCESTSVGC